MSRVLLLDGTGVIGPDVVGAVTLGHAVAISLVYAPVSEPGMMFQSFTELQMGVRELRARGEMTAARELVERHLGAFRLHRALLFLTLAELLADSGRSAEALATLTEP